MDLSIIKKISLIVVIAILFSFLNFSIIDMFLPNLEYDDYCHEDTFYPDAQENCIDAIPTEVEIAKCESTGGEMRNDYNRVSKCPSYECVPCKGNHKEAQESHDFYSFLIASILGLTCVILGMYVSTKNDVYKWVWNGVLIAGIITIFIGTGQYFRYLGRFLKPIVLMAEIGLIIWIAVKTTQKRLSEKSTKKQSKSKVKTAKKSLTKTLSSKATGAQKPKVSREKATKKKTTSKKR